MNGVMMELEQWMDEHESVIGEFTNIDKELEEMMYAKAWKEALTTP